MTDAYQAGLAAGQNGQPELTNPHLISAGDLLAYRQWAQGWEQGRRLYDSAYGRYRRANPEPTEPIPAVLQ